MSQLPRKDTRVIAREIAKKLGESDAKPYAQIARIITLCGEDFAKQVLADTLVIESGEGMMTMDGSRRRTPGGVFFQLARERMPEDACQQIFYPWGYTARKVAEKEAHYSEFVWDSRVEILQEVVAGKGKVNDVRVTLKGRPGAIERRQFLVVTAMQSQIEEQVNFPGGVPQPSSEPVTYVVYISAKQWERVSKLIEEDPDDELVVEGYCAFDDEMKGVAVHATYTTTTKTLKKERQLLTPQKESTGKAKEAGKPAHKGKDQKGKDKDKKPAPQNVLSETKTKKETPKPQEASSVTEAPKPKEVKLPPPVTPVEVNIPPGVPADVARRLVDLYTAAATFRQKIADIQSKPDGQQFGLEMTQKLLTNTEKQIQELLKPYTT